MNYDLPKSLLDNLTTAVLLLTHDDVKEPEQDKQTSRFEVIPSVTARGASATAKVRF